MLPEKEMVRALQTLFSEKLMVDVEPPEADLLETGILDSLKLVELLFHLEQEFGLNVAIDELDTEDFRSLESIARLMAGQRVLAQVTP